MSEELPDRLICFAHGKESGPWGTKITHLAEVARRSGFAVLSPDYRQTPDPRARLAQLLALRPRAQRTLILAGSSMGGFVAAFAAAPLRAQALFLIAPALYFPGYDEEPPRFEGEIAVVHGWNDDVVPVERSLRYARPRGAALHLLDSGHTLTDQLPALGLLFGDLLQRHAQAAA